MTTNSRSLPNWTQDELILACDLIESNGWREVRATDPRAIELSQVLRNYWAIQSANEYGSTFRSPNSVQRKGANIITARKEYQLKPTRGGGQDLLVVNLFEADAAKMHERAVALRGMIAELSATDTPDHDSIDVEDYDVAEGSLLERVRRCLGRNRGIRDDAVRVYKRGHGHVSCEACSFNFAAMYGPRGEDYIECHHRVPLSESGPTRTGIKDLKLLCSNCHRMIHRRRPWLSFEELVALIAR